MSYKIFRFVMQKGDCFSGIRHVLLKNQRMASSRSDAELERELEIEASLFENSSQKHEPVLPHEYAHLKKDNLKKFSNQFRSSSVRKEMSSAIEKGKVINDDELGIKFYRNNNFLSNVLTLARSRKRRDKEQKIIIEGRRLISEAINCKLHMDALIFSKKDQILEIKDEIVNAQRMFNSKIFKISQHELKMWSSLTTPPGLMAIFERPSEICIEKNLNSNPLPITVVCDNIREPNNLGSIIRTCAALPCSQLIVTKGCCDPWDSKALRGACGGHFRLPIRDDVYWSDLNKWIPSDCQDDFRVFIAENNANKAMKENGVITTNYQDLDTIGAHNLVVVGGESHGVSAEAYKFLESGIRGKCLFIPLSNGMESLNVASALTLILYEFRNRLLNNLSDSK